MNNSFFKSAWSFLFDTSASKTADMKNLKVGDAAPDFAARNENGATVRLADFAGRKLALFFYPADNTPTCTVEACNLRDAYADLQAKGVAVVGVSPDSEKKHRNFIKKFDFPFPLIADEDLILMNDYGVWGLKKFMGREFDGVHRTTFLIDENGKIEQIFEKVESANHAEQILRTL